MSKALLGFHMFEKGREGGTFAGGDGQGGFTEDLTCTGVLFFLFLLVFPTIVQDCHPRVILSACLRDCQPAAHFGGRQQSGGGSRSEPSR
jgi:hypothetical protein